MKYAHAFRRAEERRTQAWRTQLEGALEEIERRMGEGAVDQLMDNDEFVDAVWSATRIAERNSSEAKRRMLHNALVNTARLDLGVDKRAIFLRYVDELTASHMQLLAFFNDPVGHAHHHSKKSWPSNILAGSLLQVLKEFFPALCNDEGLLDTLVKDLNEAGLTNGAGLRVVMTGNGLVQQRSSTKGREFLAFVSEPPPD